MSGKSPTCCCCGIKTGTIVLLVLYLLGGAYDVYKGARGVSAASYYGTSYGLTQSWVTLVIGVLILLFSSLALHGINKNQHHLLLPMFVLQMLGLFCYAVITGLLAIYWSKIEGQIYLYIEMMNQDGETLEWLQQNPSALPAIVFSSLTAYILLQVYFGTVVFRCYKFIAKQSSQSSGNFTQFQSAPEIRMEAGPIYAPPAYSDKQKVPLVTDVDDYVHEKLPSQYIA